VNCTFTPDTPPKVKTVVYMKRPPSSSRQGQGDHIVAYSLIQMAMTTAVVGKPIDQAGQALAELLTASKEFVKSGSINKWWHNSADHVIGRLESLNPVNKEQLKWGINQTALLLNQMPGSAHKNPKSTKGHDEGGSKGGITYLEKQVARGKQVKGNVWENVLGLFDETAAPALLSNPSKLEEKLEWLMALFSRAAPTVYGKIEANDLTLIPETNLTAAVHNKFPNPMTALEVQSTIQAWIAA
jgi:hypothetical protein